MSANNYTLIFQIKGRWYLWDNLNAEEPWEDDEFTTADADKSFETLEEAVSWANKNCDTEYGYTIQDLRRPKDGSLVKLKQNGISQK